MYFVIIKFITTSLLILGVWLTLYAIRGLIAGEMQTDQQIIFETKYRISKGFESATSDIKKASRELRSKKASQNFIVMSLGYFFLIVSSILYIVTKKPPLSLKKLTIPLFVNVLYLALIILSIVFVVSGGFQFIRDCTVDWVFLFITAAIPGYYFGYNIWFNRIRERNNMNTRFFILLILYTLLGSVTVISLTIYSCYKTGDFSGVQIISILQPLALFSFISFIHIFVGFLIRKLIFKLENKIVRILNSSRSLIS